MRAAGLGVINDGGGDGAAGGQGAGFLHLAQVVPAEFAGFAAAVGGGIGDVGGGAAAFARQADADEALADGEDDAAGHVVPGVALVALHDRELDAVDEQQFVEGEAEGLGDQHVDFDECHAAGVIGSEGAVALPVGGELGEEILRQARVGGLTPGLGGEGVPSRQRRLL